MSSILSKADIINSLSLEQMADMLASIAHGHQNQRRLYTNEPYIVHPRAVANIVKNVTKDENMIAAALLHDVVEDTAIDLDFIERKFGAVVAEMVDGLTDISEPSYGNREQRKALDRAHTELQSSKTKTIKLADLIHNTKSIVEHDPKFAKTYLHEKELLLHVLVEGDYTLLAAAAWQLKRAKEKFNLIDDTI